MMKPAYRIIALLLILLVMGLTLTASDRVQAADAPPQWAFGAVETHYAPALAEDLGLGWTRAEFNWTVIQPDGPDQWLEPDMNDEELDGELAAGREVIGLLIDIPEWARADDGMPIGLYLPYDDPGNLWAAYVYQAVNRYAGRINHWIIWNEPDIWDRSYPAYSWYGDEADFVQLMRVSYLAAHEANPGSVLHLAAMTHWWDDLYDRELYFERLMDALIADPEAAEYGYYFDVATMHIYFNPATTFDLLEQYGGILRDHGMDQRIWLVESNAAPSQDPARWVDDPSFRVSLLEQAAYVPQASALALAAGAERISFYKLIDSPRDLLANPEPFGLARTVGEVRPAYHTAAFAIEMLGHVESADWADRGTVAQVVLTDDESVIRMLWSRLPAAQGVSVQVDGPVVMYDMWGNELDVDTQSGTVTLTLIGGECQETIEDYCMIGGPPVYIVSANNGALPDTTFTVDEMPVSVAEPVSMAFPWPVFLIGTATLLSVMGVGGWLIVARLIKGESDHA